MAYLTPDGLRTILDPSYSGTGTSTDTGSAASMTNTELQRAIDDASAELDGKLRARTTVPVPGTLPTLLARIVADIAAWLATLTFRRGDPLASDDPIQRRYDAAEKLLDGLASGAVALPSPLDPVDYTPSVPVAVNGYDGSLLDGGDAGWRRVPGGWTPPREVDGWDYGRSW